MSDSSQKPRPIATPIQSIEVINKMVSILFTYKRSVTYKDIDSVADLHSATISQGLSATRDLGLTRLAGKRGLYILTEEGEEYARLITAHKEDESKAYLRNVILRNPQWTDILLFLKATSGQARDPLDLVLDIERKLGKKWSAGMRNRLRASYVSILTHVGLVQKEGGKIISTIQPELAIRRKEPAKVTFTTPEDFERLETNDFKFEVRKDSDAIEFAKAQFLVWIEYVEKKVSQEKNESVE